MRRFAAIGLFVSVVLSTVTATGPAEAGQSAPSPKISPASAITHERVTISGRLGREARPLLLQRRTKNHRWVRVVRDRTNRHGRYVTRITAPRTTTRVRVLAPRWHGDPARTSKPRRLRVRAQSGALSLPQQALQDQRATATARFTPRRPGRLVLLQTRQSGTWRTMARARQDRMGRTGFTVRSTTAGTRTFRAVTVAARGAASRHTPPRSIRFRTEQPPEPSVPEPVEVPRIDLTTDSGDPVENSDDYVEGSFALVDPSDEAAAHQGRARFRVRGNSTSWVAKKPYKIKLDDKAALLGMPADKTWVLLAHEYDKSLMRNAVASEIARRVSTDYAPRMKFVEVSLNGEYRGLYQLSEQIQVDHDRVDLSNAGFLLEADSWASDDPAFTTSRGLHVNIKDPDPPTAQERSEVAERIQEFEDVLYSSGFSDPVTGYASYVDVDAFIDWYLVNETTKNIDANFMNSCWMYLDRDPDGTFGPLRLGPVWDFDHSAGNRTDDHGWGLDSPAGWWLREPMPHPPSQMKGPEGHWLNRMFEDPAFVERVQSRWAQEYPGLRTLDDYLDDTANLVADAAERNYEVWPIGPEWANQEHVFWGSWPAEVEHLRDWLATRVDWLNLAYSSESAGIR